MKKCIGFCVAALLALLVVPFAAISVSAHAEEGDPAPIDLLAEEGSWKHNKSGSLNPDCVITEGGTISLTPRSTIGSTYAGRAMGQGRISFTYQVTPDAYYYGLDDDLSTWHDALSGGGVQVFFGVTFLNAPRGVKTASSVLAVPFNSGAGGFPYMVAIDSERQNRGGDEVRARQLGLTLRRYKFDGSHDYTRWSSVEPTNATYINSNGDSYESKVPDYNAPVGLDKCFDEKEHTVDIDVKNLYKDKGDAVDAVQIEVYFDGTLSLRVIDEMPFETDAGPDEFLDKRKSDGWISLYAHGGTQDIAKEEDEYTVTIKAFSGIFRESNGGDLEGETDDGKKKGCGSSAAAASLPAAAIALCGAVCLAKKGKKDRARR